MYSFTLSLILTVIFSAFAYGFGYHAWHYEDQDGAVCLGMFCLIFVALAATFLKSLLECAARLDRGK